jgi:septal ring factor EnvC (AmiA/AmiB activator)
MQAKYHAAEAKLEAVNSTKDSLYSSHAQLEKDIDNLQTQLSEANLVCSETFKRLEATETQLRHSQDEVVS